MVMTRVDVITPTLAQAIQDLRAGQNPYEVANDLAWLHKYLTVGIECPRRTALRLVKHEEISDEVVRGEYRDD
jgi:hypothetical protein